MIQEFDPNLPVELLRAKGWGLFVIDDDNTGRVELIAQRGAVDTVEKLATYAIMPYAETYEQVLREIENGRLTKQIPFFRGLSPPLPLELIAFLMDYAVFKACEHKGFNEPLLIPYDSLESAISLITPYNPSFRTPRRGRGPLGPEYN